MPAKSAAQKRLMDAAAHNPAFAKKVGIPPKVAKEFSSESKGMKFRKGGEMRESKAMMKKEVSFMKKKGAPKAMVKHEMAEMKGMKSGGKAYAKGGTVGASKMGAVKTAAPSRDGVAVKGKTRGKMVTMAGGKGMMRGGKC
jgi:hypothetical protein